MSISQVTQDGSTRYANARPAAERQMPWDVMGSALSVTATTDVAAALAETGLDYEVTMKPVVAYTLAEDAPLAFADFHEAPKARAVVRPMPDGTQKVLGITGTRFTPIQNTAAFAVGNTMVEQGATITGLADFRSGAASLLVLNLNRGITLNRPDGLEDRLDLNLLIKNAHDGSAALTFALTPMRLACTNAVQAAISKAERVWKISHTPRAEQRVDLAAAAILKALDYQEAFQVKAQAMLDTEMVDAEFDKIVQRLWPLKADAVGATAERREDLHTQVKALYRGSETLAGIRGTRWGAYNALTEYLDHYRPVKGNADVARAEGALEGPNVRLKAQVWKLLSV